MPSGRQLLIPHLDGIPVAHHFHAGEQASIQLARVLVELEIADPADWRRVRCDPRDYVQATPIGGSTCMAAGSFAGGSTLA